MNGPYLNRRYLVSFDSRRLGHIFTDVLVLGSGVAGMRAALEASRHGEVILATKGGVEDSNSYYAQGGLAAVMDPDDTVDSHVADTLATGAGLSDEAVVRHVVGGAPQAIREMADWGVAFDASGGALDLGREGGHSRSRPAARWTSGARAATAARGSSTPTATPPAGRWWRCSPSGAARASGSRSSTTASCSTW
jgi:glycine/D-amino acid oxidase-like deaminating enzyme